MKKSINLFKRSTILKEKSVFYTGFKGNILKSVLVMIFSAFFFSGYAQCVDIQNYDLAFEENDDCKLPQVDVNIVNINEGNKNWTVEILQIFIKYTGDVVIDEIRTRQYINDKITYYYESVPNTQEFVNFSNSSGSGIISIIAKVKTGFDRQTIESMKDLITIFFSQGSDSSVDFEFLYDDPNESHMEVYDESECYNWYPLKDGMAQDYDITRTFEFENVVSNYDFVFGEVDYCLPPQVDVKIDDIINSSLGVKNLEVYIKYIYNDNSFQINEDETLTSLNSLIDDNYEKIPGNENIVIFNPYGSTKTISIVAKLKEGGTEQTIDDIKDIITIFFEGDPNTTVNFSFFYGNGNPQSLMLLNDGVDCFLSYPNVANENINRQYTFQQPVENYDLAFGEVTKPVGEQCASNMVSAKVVSMDNPTWEINNLNVYIEYSGDLVIDEDLTKESLHKKIKENYVGLNSGDIVTFDNGMISINAYNPINPAKFSDFDELEDLLTVYFTGNPGEIVGFSFSNSNPKSMMNLYDVENEIDCITALPKEDIDNPNYNITIDDFEFEGVEVVGLISTMSNLERKGKCNTIDVEAMEDVDVSYYNMNKDPFVPYCVSTSDNAGIFGCNVAPDCIKRIVPEKEICDKCGLTEFDIQKIRDVIFGGSFDYAYQPFVADMNNNGIVTTLDIVYIARILLGLQPYTGYTDFKFIPADVFQNFQNVGNYSVHVPDYNPYIEFEDTPIYNSVQFFAFKSGDVVKDMDFVDEGCDHCFPTDCFGSGGGHGKLIQEHLITINTSENTNSLLLTGTTLGKDSFDLISTTIQVKPIGMKLDTLLLFDSDEEIPGYSYDKESGILKILWINKNSYTLNTSNTNNLFTMVFDKEDYSSEDLNLSLKENDKLNNCIKNNNIVYKTTLANDIGLRVIKNIDFNISPTIFDNELNINYACSSKSKMNFILYDYQGKVLLNIEKDIHKGNNIITIDNFNNIPCGMVFYKTVIDERVFTGKLIKIQNSIYTTK